MKHSTTRDRRESVPSILFIEENTKIFLVYENTTEKLMIIIRKKNHVYIRFIIKLTISLPIAVRLIVPTIFDCDFLHYFGYACQ